MVRIKGANSDYIFDAKTGRIEEQSKEQPVYLKIFICPNDMPSQVEPPQDSKWCQGVDATCPHSNKQAGHALIYLHQTEGIALETPHTIAAKGKFVIQPKDQKTVFQATEDGVTIAAPLTVKTKPENGTQMTINAQEITLQTADGAKIQIKGDSLEITPSKTGKVKINGNLDVTGEITMAGKKLPTS